MAFENVGHSNVKIAWSFRGPTNLYNEYEGANNLQSPITSEILKISGPTNIPHKFLATGVIIVPPEDNKIPLRVGYTGGVALIGGITIAPDYPTFFSLIPTAPNNVGFTLSPDPPVGGPVIQVRFVWL